VQTARDLAQEHGRPVSDQIAQRLTETLDAAPVDPGAAQLLRSGQLTSALRNVGFGVVDETAEPAQLAPVKPRVVRSRPKPPATRATKPGRKPSTVDATLRRRRAELESRAQEAKTDYTAAEAERVDPEAHLDAHEHLIADLTTTVQRLNDELEQPRQQLRDANRRTKRLKAARDRATRTPPSPSRAATRTSNDSPASTTDRTAPKRLGQHRTFAGPAMLRIDRSHGAAGSAVWRLCAGVGGGVHAV
jgi:hypothetical protein